MLLGSARRSARGVEYTASKDGEARKTPNEGRLGSDGIDRVTKSLVSGRFRE